MQPLAQMMPLVRLPRIAKISVVAQRRRAFRRHLGGLAAAAIVVVAEGNHYALTFSAGEEFARVEVRGSALTQTWSTLTPFDPTTAMGLSFTASGTAGTSGQLVLDDIELLGEGDITAVEPNPIVALPKVNQLGFLPTGPKRLTVTVTGDLPPTVFEVRTTDGDVVQSGTLSPPLDETAATGERVVTGDFSELSAPGQYVVVVDGGESVPFVVDDTIYAPLYRDALRAFYLIRSGVAIDDVETGISHAASHTSDALLRSDGTTRRDLVGGWYNAGDYGKWAHMAALSTAYMLWLEGQTTENAALVFVSGHFTDSSAAGADGAEGPDGAGSGAADVPEAADVPDTADIPEAAEAGGVPSARKGAGCGCSTATTAAQPRVAALALALTALLQQRRRRRPKGVVNGSTIPATAQ